MTDFGEYSKSFITNVPADNSSEEALNLKSKIIDFPEEGVYVYCFEKGKMIFTDGWKEVTGQENNEVSMLSIVNMTVPQYAPFVHEINDKALMFLHQRDQRVLEYTFTIEIKILHKDGSEIPVRATVSVHDVFPNGRLRRIMGRFQVSRNLRFGKIIQYSAFGPEKSEFENDLNTNLFHKHHISKKELEALKLVSKGYALKEVAAELGVSLSAIEKRVFPLYKRFDVKSMPHLISFSYENFLLP